MKLRVKRKGLTIICICILLLAAAIVMHGFHQGKNTHTRSGVVIKNREKIVQTIRTGLREHSREITIRFHANRDHMDGIEVMVSELMEAALEETSRADEGDYIRYQYGGYEVRYSHSKEDKGYLYRVRIIPRYYTDLAEEQWVSDEIGRIVSAMDFSWRSTDYDKVSAIYDYVCQNVSYDVVHKNNDGKHRKTTAYAALKYRTAVCQGYSVLLYRMLREAGIETRVITGIAKVKGNEELHAWNLVCVDGAYYNVDATLDKALGSRDYFLRSDAAFSKDHWRDEKFTTDPFCAHYPVAAHDYNN